MSESEELEKVYGGSDDPRQLIGLEECRRICAERIPLEAEGCRLFLGLGGVPYPLRKADKVLADGRQVLRLVLGLKLGGSMTVQEVMEAADSWHERSGEPVEIGLADSSLAPVPVDWHRAWFDEWTNKLVVPCIGLALVPQHSWRPEDAAFFEDKQTKDKNNKEK